MELLLKRKWFTDKSTTGELYVDGEKECFTLEDVVREGEKVYGVTAIPYGRYQVTMTMSPRFKKIMPLLNNVEGFDGVRIHKGNKAEDTEGCILVGTWRTRDWINNSKKAYDDLFEKLEKADDKGEKIWITIEKEN
jgi:heme-degrading monooxygenase HmoA